MRRPVCLLCNNKVKDNNYLWDYQRKALVHKLCWKTNKNIKDALVTLPTLGVGANAGG